VEIEVECDMMVVITYDVNTTDASGQRRLRRVAKACTSYGQRVQNSVFECVVDAAQLASLKLKLLDIIDKNKDSLRIYRLGNQYRNKVEHFGIKETFNIEDPIIL